MTTPLTVPLAMAVVGIAVGLVPPASAGGIAVLTKAQPGLSQAGKAIWHCTYIADNRETTVILDQKCPASLRM